MSYILALPPSLTDRRSGVGAEECRYHRPRPERGQHAGDVAGGGESDRAGEDAAAHGDVQLVPAREGQGRRAQDALETETEGEGEGGERRRQVRYRCRYREKMSSG